VTALRGGDESPPSNVARTRPLAPFDVRLIAPKDGATNVSRTPTFRWAPTREVGRYRLYGVVLWDTVLGEEAFWTAVSVAVNRFGLEPETVPIRGIAIEATDNFSFTTGE